MKVSVQTDELRMFTKAVNSICDKVRFGSEFCEWKMPSLQSLEKAYELANKRGKEFMYVTPRVSNEGLEKVRSHLDGKGEIDVAINDLGVLSILENYSNLTPHLGRQLIFMPARCPWPEVSLGDILISPFFSLPSKYARWRLAKALYQTDLNYLPTIQFFQNHKVRGVDVDWIPRCFQHFGFLAKCGLNVSVHLYLVPVTLTRKCHTARFLGEKEPERCSKPCNSRAFRLKHGILGIKLFLDGNVVFNFVRPSRKDLKKLLESRTSELVVTMNPILRTQRQQDIDKLVLQMRA